MYYKLWTVRTKIRERGEYTVGDCSKNNSNLLRRVNECTNNLQFTRDASSVFPCANK